MENATEILVVILSAFLAIFLLLNIILAIILIKLALALRHIAEKAEDVVGNVEAAAGMIKKSVNPLVIGKFFVNLAETVLKKDRRK